MVLRTLIVDDHALMRAGVRAQLEKRPDILVVGEASDGQEALGLAPRLKPDVVIMDITMPGLNGIESTRAILRLLPSVAVIALSMRADTKTVAEVLRAGAKGFVLKSANAVELLTAIEAVRAGDTFLSPSVTDGIVDVFVRSDRVELARTGSSLSPREREVLQMISEGASSKQIADALCISVKTVDSHRKQIMGKLNIHSVAGLTKYAVLEGLTGLEQ